MFSKQTVLSGAQSMDPVTGLNGAKRFVRDVALFWLLYN